MVQTSYPGVYIDEFEPAPPIQAAGTSVAAFIGAASMGDINVPTQITSFNQFVSTFGARPIYGFFLWYAVRGFFDNGGTSCFVIRASNGAYARHVLVNKVVPGVNPAPANVFKIRSTQPGVPSPQLSISVTDPNRVPSTDLQVFAVTALPIVSVSSADPKRLTFNDTAWQFQAGDVIEIVSSGQPTGQTANIISSDFTANPLAGDGKYSIRLDQALANLTGKSVRFAALPRKP